VKVSVVDMTNKKIGDVDLADSVFAREDGEGMIYEVVKMQLANRRRGCACSKNRGEVSGTTAKMYRQKGTGRARHGSYKVPIFVGGGKAFGPHPRDYSYRVPKKVRRGALRAALSRKAKDGSLLIVDSFDCKEIKTKSFVDQLSKLGVTTALVIHEEPSENLMKSARNVPSAKVRSCDGLNVYDVMRYEHVIFTKVALEKVQEVLKP
jgi:large subunit ribosomal protein L4